MMVLKYLLIAAIAVFGIYILSWQIDMSRGEPNWGITFSEFYAKENLKLDWKAVYSDMLNELNPKKLRLIAYWQYLEPQKNKFDFSDLDWQINGAQNRGDDVILVVGRRVPRWPECHLPAWVSVLPEVAQENEVLNYLPTVINHYKTFSSIKAWQVENEPLFALFGACPPPNKDFLKKEIALVESLDPTRPVVITDSGELSSWFETAPLTQILGTTLYRTVWGPSVGWWTHLYPPVYYYLHAELVKTLFKTQDVVITELQAEPWAPDNKFITQLSFDQQSAHFTPADLKNNMEFAKKTGLKDIYLWGVEWWYYRKINGDSSYWEVGKEALKDGSI